MDAIVVYAETWRDEDRLAVGPRLMLDLVSMNREAMAQLATLRARVSGLQFWANATLERTQSNDSEYAEGQLNAQALVRSMLTGETPPVIGGDALE